MFSQALENCSVIHQKPELIMGHWGTGLSSNDTFMEVYETFFHYYNHNLSIEEIREKLSLHFAEIIANNQTSNDYWFALSKALWECQALDAATFNTVKHIIESRSDLKVWKELDASDKDIKSREKVLDKFLESLSTERPKAKARKKITYYSGIYEPGTCLAIKMANGNYGGLIVLIRDTDTLEGENIVAATDINMNSMPGVSDFKQANILTGRDIEIIRSIETRKEYFWIFALEAKRRRYNKEAESAFIPVGKLQVDRVFEKYFATPYRYNDNWINIVKILEDALNSFYSGEKYSISASVEEWLTGSR